MRVWAAVLLLVFLAGCGGGNRIQTEINIPDAGSQADLDADYIAGWKLLQKGETKKALESFRNSTAGEVRLHVAFGYVYLARGRFELALKNFNQAQEVDPGNMQAKMGIAEVHESQGNSEAAFQIYSRLRLQDPDNPWIKVRFQKIKSRETEKYLRKARTLEQSGMENADYLKNLENVLKYSPELAAVKEKIADYYSKMSQNDQSLAHYEEILAANPNETRIMKKLVDIYLKLKKYDSALIIYSRLMKLNPGDLELSNRINELKVKFNEMNIPVQIKNIYFKMNINREELAALLGLYFNDFFELKGSPVIITDIQHSFARDAIVKLCSLNIMRLRPDHTFGVGRYAGSNVSRAQFAVVLDSLIKYLEKTGFPVRLDPAEEPLKARDVTELHDKYRVIRFMINSRLMEPDDYGLFRPTEDIAPLDALNSIKMVLNSIKKP